jgi:hypothetical protein
MGLETGSSKRHLLDRQTPRHYAFLLYQVFHQFAQGNEVNGRRQHEKVGI